MIDLKDIGMRFVKGALIGTGFLLPGVSGGVLAAVFGLYERMISFLAHITRDFRKNILFFLPVGVGACVGIILLSAVLSYFFEQHRTPILWLFVGGILGTLPALWNKAGKQGRRLHHLVIAAGAATLGVLLLQSGEGVMTETPPLGMFTWAMAGALIALGMLVPGLSPSNFLVYLNLYKPMLDGVRELDFTVLLPLAVGGSACLLLFSKLVDALFRRFYAGLFHAIIGIVIASTIMILPLRDADAPFLLCAGTCLLGVVMGYWMGAMEP